MVIPFTRIGATLKQVFRTLAQTRLKFTWIWVRPLGTWQVQPTTK